MTPRLFRVWLLAALASSCLFVVAQAQTPAEVPAAQAISPPVHPAVPAAPEEMVGPLKWPEMPLELVLEMLETWTNRTILRPQALPPATISLKTKEPLPKSEAIRAVETALNLNGIALVRMGDKFLKVLPMQNARVESPQIIEGSSLDLPPSGQIVTKLFQLQFLRVNEFLPQIATLFNQNSPPVIFDKSNAALITDSVTTIQRIETLVQKLDQPFMSNLTPKFYSVHYAKASDLVNKLRAMLQGPLQNQLGSAVSYSADDRTNQVILICDPRQLAFFDDLMAKLDVKSDPNTSNEVIYLKHATSKDVATLLSNVISNQSKATQSSGSVQPGLGGQQPAQPQPPVPNQAPVINNPAVAAALGELGSTQFSSLASVMSDDRSNAIVVNGTKDDIRLIKDLVDKIDIVLAQVRIEVVICEVLLSDEASTGISTLGLQLEGNKLVGIAGTTPGMGVGGTIGTDGALSGMATPVGDFGLVGIVSLSTTPRKGTSRVLSVPSITTTHNKEAKLFFGETRPVVSGSTTTPISNAGNTTSSSVTQTEIGTTVTVKPLIGNDGSVQLDIKQTISDVTGTVILDGNTQYIIGKREMDSFNTVKSGEIIVLGGMQKENNTHSTSRLGPIPWIGDLLGTRSRSKTRSELVVFIRPTVLTNTPADNAPALKRIDTMPDASAIHQTLDPNYVPPKTPFYKNKAQIP